MSGLGPTAQLLLRHGQTREIDLIGSWKEARHTRHIIIIIVVVAVVDLQMIVAF